MKKLTKKQKKLFLNVAEFGMDDLYAEDFKGTELEKLINDWQYANTRLETIYDELLGEE